MELSELLAMQFNLPSIPRVVALLLFELERPEPDLQKITQLISTDPALTTRLLEISNSSYFELTGQVNSVSESLALLGLGHVRSMAAAAASGSSFKAVPGINLQQFWSYSLNVGKVSRSLAGVLRSNQQAAFTCGLIHAVGELAIHLAMPDKVTQLNPEVTPISLKRADVETRAFGYSYAEVGAGFARRWKFPQAMVDALENQCYPFEKDVYEPLAGIIHLATWRARAKEANLDQRAMAVTFPGSVGDILKLDIDMVLQQDPIDWTAAVPGKQFSS
jgi:HD-like signal output (HDOD) protein